MSLLYVPGLAGILPCHCKFSHLAVMMLIFHDPVQSVIMHLFSQVSVLSCYKRKILFTVLHRVFDVCKGQLSHYQMKVCYIEKNLLQITSNSDLVFASKLKPENRDAFTTGNKNNIIWRKYGCFALTNLHKAHLCSDNLLDDIHMCAAQESIKKHPLWWATKHCDAKLRDAIKSLKGNSDNLQIVHVELGKTNHWVFISTVSCPEGEIDLYDSYSKNQIWTHKQ